MQRTAHPCCVQMCTAAVLPSRTESRPFTAASTSSALTLMCVAVLPLPSPSACAARKFNTMSSPPAPAGGRQGTAQH